MYKMEKVTLPLTDEQRGALAADRLLTIDIFMHEPAVRNIALGIRQMIKIVGETGKAEHLQPYMGDIGDFLYLCGRIEQDLRRDRYAEDDIYVEDLNETIFE